MFKKILIIIKTGLKVDCKLIEKIKKFSKESKIKVLHFNEVNKNIFKNEDLIITVGGDGTFVKAANLIENSLILGINSNPKKSEGALTSILISELDKLKEILEGKYKIILRQRAKVFLNEKQIDEHAINEVYIGAASQFHTSRYELEFKGKNEEHRSSGVIVSTGSGSGAWFYSAGGKKFKFHEEKLAFIVREPYFGKNVFKPKILYGEIKKGEILTIKSKRDFGGILSVNDAVYPFNKGDVAKITLSDKPLRVVQPK